MAHTNPVVSAVPEGLEIGSNSLAPVWPEYQPPFTFTGRIKQVVSVVVSDQVTATQAHADAAHTAAAKTMLAE